MTAAARRAVHDHGTSAVILGIVAICEWPSEPTQATGRSRVVGTSAFEMGRRRKQRATDRQPDDNGRKQSVDVPSHIGILTDIADLGKWNAGARSIMKKPVRARHGKL